jgi:hypothetical protein
MNESVGQYAIPGSPDPRPTKGGSGVGNIWRGGYDVHLVGQRDVVCLYHTLHAQYYEHAYHELQCHLAHGLVSSTCLIRDDARNVI